MKIKQLKQFIADSRAFWPKWLLLGGIIALIFGLYGYRLGSFIDLSPIETATAAANRPFSAIADNPINLPYKLANTILPHAPVGSAATHARAASALLAIGCICLFYTIIRRWYGSVPAIFATLLFAPAGWILQSGRFGGGLIMLSFMVLALLVAYSWLGKDSKPSGWPLVGFGLIAGAALLVPGGLWFVLATTIVVRRQLLIHIKAARWWQTIIATLAIGLAIALVGLTSWRQPQLAWAWLGIPAALPGVVELAKQAAGSLTYLVARGPFIPQVWLAHTPLLDAATTALLIFGSIVYTRRWKTSQTAILSSFALIGAALITLNGAYGLAYLAPVAYVVAATGLIYLIRQWYKIFPRNPFAHSLAALLIVGLLAAIGAYHTQRYFVAWRNSPDTIQAYQATETPAELPDLLR